MESREDGLAGSEEKVNSPRVPRAAEFDEFVSGDACNCSEESALVEAVCLCASEAGLRSCPQGGSNGLLTGLGDVAAYIRANPVRAGLCDDSKDYRFAGCVMPGYPELDMDADDYWPRFWRIYWKLRENDDSSASPL